MMHATAFVYDLADVKGKDKTYLIRKVFGYKDTSHNGLYSYDRPGEITPYVVDKWGKSVILSKKIDAHKVAKILSAHNIPYVTKDLVVD